MEVRKGKVSARSELFGGTGTVQVWNLLSGMAKRPTPFTAVLSCELDPGGDVGRHVQERYPEIVVCLSGEGEATVGRETHALGVGDVVHLALGSVLAIRNLSTEEPLRYLIIKAEGRPAASSSCAD